MDTKTVQTYVDNQVRQLADRRIKPIMDAINGELEFKRRNDERKAAIDKESAEADTRIVKFQQELGKANAEVNDLAVKLAEAVAGAPNDGSTTPVVS
jgi:predicted RNase H-like nuclease (RuvC/YqgF family)